MNDELVAEMRTPPPRVVEALQRGDEIMSLLERTEKDREAARTRFALPVRYSTRDISGFMECLREMRGEFADVADYPWLPPHPRTPMSDADWQHEMTRPLN